MCIRDSYIAFLPILSVFSCKSQQQLAAAKSVEAPFERIVYRSSYCFGTCPKIDMEIKADKSIKLQRETISIKGMGEASLHKYEGFLTDSEFDSLVTVINKANYRKLKFGDVMCCDGVVYDFTFYNTDGTTKKLKSMFPPQEAHLLIDYFSRLGLRTDLPEVENIEIKD